EPIWKESASQAGCGMGGILFGDAQDNISRRSQCSWVKEPCRNDACLVREAAAQPGSARGLEDSPVFDAGFLDDLASLDIEDAHPLQFHEIAGGYRRFI